ncbi:MAG TPA: FHA domain-containing protein [Ktedonobacterales bacterium]|nr:FHA domain-containing protein [Ktedonobacterales bacterium]
MDGTAFPAWMGAGSFGGLTCAMLAAALLAVWALVYRRGTTRQSALAILICLACAALMIFPVWWDLSRFAFFGSSLDDIEITVVLAWVAVFGWTLPLGMLISYMLLAEPHLQVETPMHTHSPHIEATLRLALADPARYVSVKTDGAPWAQLATVNDEDSGAGMRPVLLRKRLTVLGREVDNDVVLNDVRVSRHHAEIRMDHGRAVLLDYGSTNGTLINTQRVVRPTPLQPGDIVELGMRRYQFSLLTGPASAYEEDTSKMPGANGSNRRQTMPPAGPPALVAINGQSSGSRWNLLEPVVSIGRDATCQIRLTDTSVSRRHAQVVRQSDGFYASDIDSINGTRVNEDELTAPRRLRNGDILHVGVIDLRFVMATPDPSLTAPPAELDVEPGADGELTAGGAPSSRQTTIPLSPDSSRQAPVPQASQESRESQESDAWGD